MEVKVLQFSIFLATVKERIKGLFVKKISFSQKTELKISSFKWMGLIFVLVFVCVVLLMPDEVPIQFSEKMDQEKVQSGDPTEQIEKKSATSSSLLWATPKREFSRSGYAAEVNHNTSMMIGSSGGNAKTQLRSGTRLPLRILDKVIVSQDSVPVLAESLLDGATDSGLRLPAGTKFYGEATYTKGTDRASIVFKQISLPNGQIKGLAAKALGKDGQPGIEGRVYSDGVKNTAGQVLTTFVGGLAAGSIQTDIFGRSKGGLENGLLNAVAETARGKAQSYGENLKAEREWIEIRSGAECDALLSESMDLQYGGRNE
ncbi:MAG: TrbI/VirB10 family protein [Bdellovibrio sp.]|uniref:TrbI/VirB10 family protein n=1 Tax=Bdellovibrio sp. TaxID=28201 RepID=UPI0039E5298C|nr:TrbI/VirB10 family protein [Bdellovibrio sp.]